MQVLEGLLEVEESCLEVWYLLALAQYAGGAPDVAKETLQTLDDLLAKPGAIAPTDDPPDLIDLKVLSRCCCHSSHPPCILGALLAPVGRSDTPRTCMPLMHLVA